MNTIGESAFWPGVACLSDWPQLWRRASPNLTHVVSRKCVTDRFAMCPLITPTLGPVIHIISICPSIQMLRIYAGWVITMMQYEFAI